MIRGLVVRGLIAGLLGGLGAGAVGLAIGEGQVDRAIAVESGLAARTAEPAHGGRAHGHAASASDADAVEVSRETQHVGLVLATGLYGVALGGLLALGFAALRGRTAHRSDRRLALGLTSALFVAVVVVPWIKYPANPPGVGDPETIGYRTELYLLLVAGAVAALLASWRVARLVPTGRRGRRAAAAAASFCALIGILIVALPGLDELPPAYPPGLVDDFRVASASLQLTLWSVLGVSFSILVDRPSRGHARRPRPC